MRHRLRVKLVFLGCATAGAGLTAAMLAACSIDIDGTAPPAADSGPLSDVTTPKLDGAADAAADGAPLDATTGDSALAPDAAPDAAPPIDAAPAFDGGPYAGNNAAVFTGDATGYVNATPAGGAPVVQDDFTLEAWIYPTSIQNTKNLTEGNQLFIADQAGAGENDYSSFLYKPMIGTPTPVLAFVTGLGDGANDSLGVTSDKIDTSVWTHVAIVRNKAMGQVLFYLNGTLNVTTPGASKSSLDSEPYLDIGGGVTSGNSNGFVGMIDEVRVWSYQRAAIDIAADQVDQLSPATIADKRLVLYYKFDESPGASATVDSSLSGTTGSIQGNGTGKPTFAAVTGR